MQSFQLTWWNSIYAFQLELEVFVRSIQDPAAHVGFSRVLTAHLSLLTNFMLHFPLHFSPYFILYYFNYLKSFFNLAHWSHTISTEVHGGPHSRENGT